MLLLLPNSQKRIDDEHLAGSVNVAKLTGSVIGVSLQWLAVQVGVVANFAQNCQTDKDLQAAIYDAFHVARIQVLPVKSTLLFGQSTEQNLKTKNK